MKECNIFMEYLNGKISYLRNTSSEIVEWIGSDFEVNSFEIKETYINGPDLFIKLSNMVIAIEHFEFDSTRNTRKGTKNNKCRVENKRTHLHKLKNINHIGDKVNSQFKLSEKSLVNYRENLLRSYRNHYNRIKDYKNNLIKASIAESFDEIVMAFLIIDSTTDGNKFFNAITREVCPLSPLNIKEFRDEMSSSPYVDLLLLGDGIGKDKRLLVMELNENSMQDICKIALCDNRQNLFDNSITTLVKSSTLIDRTED